MKSSRREFIRLSGTISAAALLGAAAGLEQSFAGPGARVPFRDMAGPPRPAPVRPWPRPGTAIGAAADSAEA